jgi:zinc protease
VLANGMRYAVMRSALPAGGLAVRMRIDVGAVAESGREQGFVHLIEHLAFRGSANLPEGAAALMLHRDGLQRRADFNAFTGFDETIYRLDLAKADPRARETALMVMHEIATNLRFTGRIVRGAKADVRAELAARDPLPDRLLAAKHALFLPGSAIDRGPVTGTAASVNGASPEQLRRLYALYYVPERTVLVMVGDFDPAVVVAEIEARFADWRPGPAAERTAPPAAPAVARPPGWDGIERGPTIGLLADRNAPTTVTLATIRPIDAATDSGKARDTQFLERLGSAMLARRLEAAAAAGGAFTGSSAESYAWFGIARIASLELTARNGDWRGAMIAGEQALRQLRDAGFSQAELDAQIAISRHELAAAAAPRPSAALADAIIDALSRGLVFTEPADPVTSEAYLARVKLAEVNAAMKAAIWHGQRFLFVTHDRKIPGDTRAISAAWSRAFIATDPTSEVLIR